MNFMGYRRPDGRVGTRNYVGVLSTVVCANEVARSNKLATYTVQVTDDDNDVVAIFQGMVYRKKDSLIPTDGNHRENV